VDPGSRRHVLGGRCLDRARFGCALTLVETDAGRVMFLREKSGCSVWESLRADSGRGRRADSTNPASVRSRRCRVCDPEVGRIVVVMFRITFLVDDPTKRQGLATELRALPMAGGTRVVSAFVYAKTVEVFVEIGDSAVPREVADQLARALGVDEYEVVSADPLATGSPEGAVSNARRHLRRAVITQVRVHSDGRKLSVQARHRPYETVERVDVEQTDQAVTITALIGSPEDDDRDRYVSFAVAFTWVDTVLDRPLGDREIIRDDPDRRLTRSQPPPATHDQVPERLVDATESESNADADDPTWSAWRPHLI
jgi:hypothetical protein